MNKNKRNYVQKTLNGGEKMSKISSKGLASSSEDRDIKKSKDLPLEIKKWERIDKNPSEFPNTDYFYSYQLVLANGDKVVFNSSSTRMLELVNHLVDKFDDIDNIPNGELSKKTPEDGNNFDVQFYYLYEENEK